MLSNPPPEDISNDDVALLVLVVETSPWKEAEDAGAVR